MSNFNDIKHQWAARNIPLPPEQGFDKIVDTLKTLRNKQKIGQVVLGITVLVLIGFFFYISAYKNNQVFLGLGIMIVSLLLRISFEFSSIMKKFNLPADKDMKSYRHQLIHFYKRRKYLHFIVTPILFASYIIGFIMLLPSFKQALSHGFYTYIFMSSWIIFIALAILIGFQIRKELVVLQELLDMEQ